ncbi:MAG: protein tyrosine phosphatase [Gemmatimonadota bacterium]
MPEREKLLFICSQNRIRSLTAEKLLEDDPRFDVRSAGTEQDARIKVTAGHIGWADRIFVMEKRHRDRLRKKFRGEIEGKPLIVLYIPDEYEPLGEDLFEILSARLSPYLDHPESGGA